VSFRWIRGLTQGDSWLHAVGIALLGCLLGVVFNSASPAGVAWRSQNTVGTASDPGVRGPKAIGDSKAPSLSGSKVTPTAADCMPWEHLEFRIAQSKAVAIDLRSATAYDSGHVPKAISYPLEVFGADPDSPTWQTFRAHVSVHHFVVLYGDAQPTDAMRRFRTRLIDELGYAMVMFADDGFAGWERRHATRLSRIADAESKARARLAAHKAVPAAPTVPSVPLTRASAIPNVLWIDARSRAAFEAGHIPGAISVPESSDSTVFERLRTDHPADRPIVVYCGGIGCGTSRRLAARLVRDFGFTQVHHLPGGYAEWQQTQAAKAVSREGSQ